MFGPHTPLSSSSSQYALRCVDMLLCMPLTRRENTRASVHSPASRRAQSMVS